MRSCAPRLRLILVGLALSALWIHGGQSIINKNEDLIARMLKVVPDESAAEIKRQFSFPEESTSHDYQFFWDPYDLVSDAQGNLFVSDRSNVIFKYSPDGKPILQFGRTGQGPGDLSMPFDLALAGDYLAVKESANFRVQYFEGSGKPLSTTKLRKTYCSFDVAPGGKIFGIPVLFNIDKATSLIEIISAGGTIEKAFGRILDFPYDYQQLNLANVLIKGQDELVVLFTYLPIMRRYNFDGKLIGEFPIHNRMADIKNQHNRGLYSRRPDDQVAYVRVVRGAAIFLEHIYYADFVPPRLWVYKADFEGNILKVFYASVGEHYAPVAIVPIDKNGKVGFYILTKTPEPRVDFFSQASDSAQLPAR